MVAVNHERQSESTMGKKVVGAVFLEVLAMVAVVTWSVTSPTAAGCNAALYSCSCISGCKVVCNVISVVSLQLQL